MARHSNDLSIHPWVRSAIHDSQQFTSPIVAYLWNFRHRLVRYYRYTSSRVINPKRVCKMSILRVHSILSTLESFPQHPPPLDSEGWTHARSVTLHPVLQLQNQPGGISNLALDFSIDALSMGSNGSQFALVGFHHPSRCCAAGGDFEPSDQAPGALFCVHLLYRCLR